MNVYGSITPPNNETTFQDFIYHSLAIIMLLTVIISIIIISTLLIKIIKTNKLKKEIDILEKNIFKNH